MQFNWLKQSISFGASRFSDRGHLFQVVQKQMPVRIALVDCFAGWISFLFLAEQARDYLIFCLCLGQFFNTMTWSRNVLVDKYRRKVSYIVLYYATLSLSSIWYIVGDCLKY